MPAPDQLPRITLLFMDCDGVLTDGRLYFSKEGEALKVFNVRDGQGIVSWHKAGFQCGIISGRGAKEIIQARADELAIRYVRSNSKDKVADLLEILSDADVTAGEVAYIGDDVGDIEIMKAVGLAVSVADAAQEVKAIASFVTNAKGGEGAVREVIDILLSAQSKKG